MKGKNILSGILTVVSMVGVGVTAYFCFKESSDAKEAIEEEKAKKNEDKADDEEKDELTGFETAKVIVKHMKKTAISGGLTMVAIASGQIIHVAVVGGLIASAGMWKDKYTDIDRMLQRENPELRKKIHDVLSVTNLEKKLKENDKKDQKKTPVDDLKNKAKKLTNLGNELDEFEVYDDWTKQTIYTTQTKILATKLYITTKLTAGEDVMLNEVIRRLGGKAKDAFKDIGWSCWCQDQCRQMDDLGNGSNVKLYFETYDGIRKDRKEILIMRFDVDPLKIVYHSGEEGFEAWRELGL